MSTPVLGYWNFRGLAQDIRCLLHYLKIDFEDKRYPPGPNFGDDHWLSEKFQLGLDFPNVPYFIDGDIKLSESRAILKYLARSKDPKLMSPSPLLQAKAEIVEGVLVDLYHRLVYSVYSFDKVPEEVFVATADQKLQQISRKIGNQRFLLGDTLYWIDFFLYEVLHQFGRYSPDLVKDKPEIMNYLKNFEAIPELQGYFNSPEVLHDVLLLCISVHNGLTNDKDNKIIK